MHGDLHPHEIVILVLTDSSMNKQLAGIRSGGIPIRWWDPRNHLSNRLMMMMMMIGVMVMIGLLYLWGVSRGEVETCSSFTMDL
jgi:hypothetical protein